MSAARSPLHQGARVERSRTIPAVAPSTATSFHPCWPVQRTSRRTISPSFATPTATSTGGPPTGGSRPLREQLDDAWHLGVDGGGTIVAHDAVMLCDRGAEV